MFPHFHGQSILSCHQLLLHFFCFEATNPRGNEARQCPWTMIFCCRPEQRGFSAKFKTPPGKTLSHSHTASYNMANIYGPSRYSIPFFHIFFPPKNPQSAFRVFKAPASAAFHQCAPWPRSRARPSGRPPRGRPPRRFGSISGEKT